jgi:tripartite-type tricarboxylate transporter receptor subunit TctC
LTNIRLLDILTDKEFVQRSTKKLGGTVAFGFRLAFAGTAIAILLSAPVASAQNYPNRNVTVMCGFAAGGGGDLICRYVAEKLTPLMGQRAIVENKVGAQGSIAAELTAHSKPDGYTILVTPGTAVHAGYQSLFAKPLYDPFREFTMVTTVARLAFVLVVNPKMPVNSVGDLTQWAKANKSKTGGSTTTGLVSSETYRTATGIDMLQVPYKSAQTTLLDLMAGELDFMFCDPGLAMGHLESGAIRGLAVTSITRSDSNPTLPTMAESGFPGFDVISWWAVMAPSGTPAPIVAQLRAWIDEIVLRDETKKFMNRAGIDTFPAKDMDFNKFLRDESERWKKHIEIAKITPQ